MIPEYTLYHGAFLSELIDRHPDGVAIRPVSGPGRLRNYIVAGVVGIQVRHATQRLHPWPFTFSGSHLWTLSQLHKSCESAFLILVCRTDGMLTVPADEALKSLGAADGPQSWLRADRSKREWYRLYGPAGEFPSRFPQGIDLVVEAISRLSR